MHTQVTEHEIDETVCRAQLETNGTVGAVVSFTGLVREMTGSEDETFTLEHYPGMTEKMLSRIASHAIDKFALADAVIVHRVGLMNAGDIIVLVLAAAQHRQAAFDGASYMMDYLKTRAPFWKKEANGQWVDARDADETAFQHWNK